LRNKKNKIETRGFSGSALWRMGDGPSANKNRYDEKDKGVFFWAGLAAKRKSEDKGETGIIS